MKQKQDERTQYSKEKTEKRLLRSKLSKVLGQFAFSFCPKKTKEIDKMDYFK